MSGKCIGCFVIELNISRILGKKECFFFVKFFCFLSILLKSLIPDLFIETAGANHDFCDLVRIAVGRRTTIFQVSTLMFSNISRNTDGGSSIGHTSREIMNGRGLMQTSQSSFIILAFIGIVGLDMANMMLGKPVDSSLNCYKTVGFPHGQSRKVGMCTSSIPVTRHGLRVHGSHNPKFLSNTMQQKSCNP